MSRGYLCIAQNNSDSDYIRMAYALCLSIKNTQSEVNSFAIAVEEGEEIPDYMLSVFDHVVTIPWTDHASGSEWKIENKWKYYYMTPFEETVILDADMIFIDDISYWWDIMSVNDMWFSTNVKTYKGETVTDDRYRKTFTSNELPNIYTAFAYFKKSNATSELFTLVEQIFNNWESFFYEFLDDTRPTHLSGDVAYALAIKILGIAHEVSCPNSTHLSTFVHMKSMIQKVDIKYLEEDWTISIPTYMDNKGNIKIGNFKQSDPLHYHIKTWLTDEMINKLEDIYNGNS